LFELFGEHLGIKPLDDMSHITFGDFRLHNLNIIFSFLNVSLCASFCDLWKVTSLESYVCSVVGEEDILNHQTLV
jgi:hypothetical protein